MTESKTFASLEPTLLARKGTAKPAMRPQAAPLPVVAPVAPQFEDLGWNDIHGEDSQDGEVLQLNPDQPVVAGKPEVRKQIEAIAARLSRKDDAPKQAHPRAHALESGRRAAFTLRLDRERHLKLRLACTIKNRSAQQIVTDALDRLLNAMPELDSLADQLKQR